MAVELRFRVDEGDQLKDLNEWMGGHQGVEVRPVARAAGRNSQGPEVWEFLTLTCATGGPLVAGVRAFQVWIEARVTVVEVEVGDRRFTVTGMNAKALLPEVVAAARALEAGETPDEPA
ncbi:effector-associated constant component EACC1 [Actinacidiphila alni]|uniref:effector-associated constant component EACC1 n=1 Tax=Actinacidiphila alni TaxID=380248 RepID=UPI003452FDCF